jgi:hypothetical protein
VLSESERRRLDDIARRLTASDPDFVAWMTAQRTNRLRIPGRCYTILIALSVVSAVICLALIHAGAGPAAVPALALAAGAFFLRRRRFPAAASQPR